MAIHFFHVRWKGAGRPIQYTVDGVRVTREGFIILCPDYDILMLVDSLCKERGAAIETELDTLEILECQYRASPAPRRKVS